MAIFAKKGGWWFSSLTHSFLSLPPKSYPDSVVFKNTTDFKSIRFWQSIKQWLHKLRFTALPPSINHSSIRPVHYTDKIIPIMHDVYQSARAQAINHYTLTNVRKSPLRLTKCCKSQVCGGLYFFLFDLRFSLYRIIPPILKKMHTRKENYHNHIITLFAFKIISFLVKLPKSCIPSCWCNENHNRTSSF